KDRPEPHAGRWSAYQVAAKPLGPSRYRGLPLGPIPPGLPHAAASRRGLPPKSWRPLPPRSRIRLSPLRSGSSSFDSVKLQGLLDPPNGLPDPVLVFHQREPHMFVPTVPEPDPRGDCDLRIPEQQLGELKRPHPAVRYRDARPHEHRRTRFLDRPADSVEAVDQLVPALLIAKH